VPHDPRQFGHGIVELAIADQMELTAIISSFWILASAIACANCAALPPATKADWPPSEPN
jgi:hypothetical protein